MNFSATELTLFAIAVVGLLGLNALFVATEFSLVKLRFTRFGTDKMNAAKESKFISAMLDDMGGSVKILRLGITMSTIASGFLLVPLSYSATVGMGFFEGMEIRIAMVISFTVAVSAHFILGELVPRAMALQYPVETLRVSTIFVRLFKFISKPLAVMLEASSGWLMKMMKLDPSSDLNLLDVEAQIRSLVSEGTELPEVAENIMYNALDLRKRVAHDVMIPRNQLKFFDAQDSNAENLEVARETGHTRFPLCDGDLDHCIGVIHIKDVFRSEKSPEEIDLGEIKRDMLRFSMDLPLENALQEFLLKRKHFAMLIDEFGGAVGAITLEDVLEELVGEIQDEFDRETELIHELDDGRFVVDGLTPLHELAETISVKLEAEEVSTFGGFITLELGRMPRKGEVFSIGNLEIVADNVDERRVLAATLRVVHETEVVEEKNG